jgi:hypothetical protein
MSEVFRDTVTFEKAWKTRRFMHQPDERQLDTSGAREGLDQGF